MCYRYICCKILRQNCRSNTTSISLWPNTYRRFVNQSLTLHKLTDFETRTTVFMPADVLYLVFRGIRVASDRFPRSHIQWLTPMFIQFKFLRISLRKPACNVTYLSSTCLCTVCSTSHWTVTPYTPLVSHAVCQSLTRFWFWFWRSWLVCWFRFFVRTSTTFGLHVTSA